jgi:hypothetical protein
MDAKETLTKRLAILTAQLTIIENQYLIQKDSFERQIAEVRRQLEVTA